MSMAKDGKGTTPPIPESVYPHVSQFSPQHAEQNWALLAAIVGSSEDAIVSKTLTGIVTSWNAAAERLFGYTAAEMIGQSITRVIPPELLHEEADILNKIRNGERIDR